MNTDSIISKLVTAKDFIARHAVVIFATLAVAVLSFITLQIDSLSRAEPTDAQKAERQAAVRPVTLDSDSVAKIKELQDQNVSIEALFDNGRDNPFQ